MIFLSVSCAIWTWKLFNRNPDLKCFELFKCLDGSLTPKSIGIHEKKIVKIILILTKFGFKILKLAIIVLGPIGFVIPIYLFHKNGHINSSIELIPILIWYLLTFFVGIFISLTIGIPSTCFKILTFYCFLNARHFNQSINHVKIQMQFGCKRFIMKLKIKYLVRKIFVKTLLKFSYNFSHH